MSLLRRRHQPGSGRLAAVLVLAACVAAAVRVADAPAQGGVLTVYSSLPLQGAAKDQSQAILNGAKVALDEVGGRVGAFSVRHVSLDDSSATNPGVADRDATLANARRAAADPSAVAYIGEFNSSGTAYSLPILNAAAIAQVSPSNTYVGLTSDAPGSAPGEPAKYYPSGQRTYARIQPNDTVQGAALATLMRRDGCRSATLWHDRSRYARGLVSAIRRVGATIGLRVRGVRGTSVRRSYRAFARTVRTRCFFWGGVTDTGAVRVFTDVLRAVPNARLYAPDGVAEERFTNPRRGGVSTRVARRLKIAIATIQSHPGPGAARFAERYAATFASAPDDPYAIYGYEAMALALDALARAANPADRRAVVAALFATRDRPSVIGTYSIDAAGDTTLRNFGVYRIRRGQLSYSGTIFAAG